MPRSPRTSSGSPTTATSRRCRDRSATRPRASRVVDAYIDATAAVAPAPAGADGLRWVYTAMHGVGWETLVADRSRRPGTPRRSRSPAQLEPDGAFPTVAFPNPEEPGAMDLAFEPARAARRRVRHRERPRRRPARGRGARRDAEGGWRRLSGNEIGLLLGWRGGEARRPSGCAGRRIARVLARLVARARGGRRALRPRLPRDAHRVQVDLARARARVRVRGGARLPRESRDRARQGRHLGRDRDPRAGRRGPGAGREHHRPPRRVRRDVRALRQRPDRDARRRRVDDRPDHGGAAGAASVGDRRRRASTASTTCSTACDGFPPATCCAVARRTARG